MNIKFSCCIHDVVCINIIMVFELEQIRVRCSENRTAFILRYTYELVLRDTYYTLLHENKFK